MKKVIVAGASGLIGKNLCSTLKNRGYKVIVVTRNSKKGNPFNGFVDKYVEWSQREELNREIDGSFAIINLSGAPIIGKRWSRKYKEIILNSRISTTQTLVSSIKKTKTKPKVFINGSAVGYYGEKTNYLCTEEKNAGHDFLAQVCREWEHEVLKVEKEKVRVVLIRSGIVLDKSDGALAKMLPPFQFFIGGPIGSGKQFFPWIHIQDEVGIILFALENEKVKGPINTVAPEATTNKIFSKSLGKVLNRPSLLPIPGFFLKIIFGEASSTLTSGVNVSSKKIESLGYIFKYPKLENALKNLLKD